MVQKLGEIVSIFTTIKDKQKTSFGPIVSFNCTNYECENTAVSKLANVTIKIEKKMTKFTLLSYFIASSLSGNISATAELLVLSCILFNL